MKPHPRIRKTIKWGGAVVTVLLVVVWVASAWWRVGWMSRRACGIVVEKGQVVLAFQDVAPDPELDLFAGWQIRRHRWPLSWQFAGGKANFGWVFWVPLWAPTMAVLIPTVAAWRTDLIARRRAKLNLCPKCGYDRTGLARDAKCPECGAVPDRNA